MRSVARADVTGGLSACVSVSKKFRADERERAEPGVDEGDRASTDRKEDDHGGASDKGTGERGERGERGSSRRGGRVSDNARPPLRAELARLPKLLGVAGRRGACAGDAESRSATRFPEGETRGDENGGAGGKPSSTRNANGVSNRAFGVGKSDALVFAGARDEFRVGADFFARDVSDFGVARDSRDSGSPRGRDGRDALRRIAAAFCLLRFISASAAARRTRSRSRKPGDSFLRASVSSASLRRISRGSNQDARRSTAPSARFFCAAARAFASRMRRTVFSNPRGAPAGRRGGARRAAFAPRGSQGLRVSDKDAFSSRARRRSSASDTANASAPRVALFLFVFVLVFVSAALARNLELRLMRGANVHSASSRASFSSRDVRAGGLSRRSPVTAENASASAVSWLRRSARAAREGEKTRSDASVSPRPPPRDGVDRRRVEDGRGVSFGRNVHSAASSASRAARAASTAASAAARFAARRSATFARDLVFRDDGVTPSATASAGLTGVMSGIAAAGDDFVFFPRGVRLSVSRAAFLRDETRENQSAPWLARQAARHRRRGRLRRDGHASPRRVHARDARAAAHRGARKENARNARVEKHARVSAPVETQGERPRNNTERNRGCACHARRLTGAAARRDRRGNAFTGQIARHSRAFLAARG
mmetsp:Transcript_4320/g.18376  ORF Transcript_4320/g.18376 Transcript_4320/m.18376 type:complete len:659 (-) Transcript_4320:247-2223(-)